jgi:hypothetical protein
MQVKRMKTRLPPFDIIVEDVEPDDMKEKPLEEYVEQSIDFEESVIKPLQS